MVLRRGRAELSARIAQKAFIAALAGGRRLEIKRAGKLLHTFPIAGSAAMARSFSECVAKAPSF